MSKMLPKHILNFVMTNLLFAATAFGAAVDGNLAAKIAAANPQLPPIALKKAFQYLAAHEDVFKNQEYMAIANFDQPSTEKRLYLVNLRTGDTEAFLVSHGKNSSDPDDRKITKYFSNAHKSKKSSLGFYRTLDKNEEVVITNSEGSTYKSKGIYSGKHGRSLRLKGVQSTNSNALNREIVLHGASYVSSAFIKAKGRLGESWGCPAVNFDVRDKIMDRVEGRALFYIYKTPEEDAPAKSESAKSDSAKKVEMKSSVKTATATTTSTTAKKSSAPAQKAKPVTVAKVAAQKTKTETMPKTKAAAAPAKAPVKTPAKTKTTTATRDASGKTKSRRS